MSVLRKKQKQSPTVLVVDDQPQNLRILGSVLANEGYRLSFATSGEQALEILQNLDPDLVLLDIMMEGIDGYETCKRIREQDRLALVPILFLTTKSESEDIVRAFECGGMDYITKPFRTPELLARVETHIKLKETTVELARANEAKAELMSMAAHDLKNPISVIIGMADILIDSYTSNTKFDFTKEERLELLHDISSCSENMLQIIKDLLNIETISKGIVTLHTQPALLNEILQEILALNAPQARAKEITVSNFTDSEQLVEVDVPRIREVFDNLISNAIKYSPKGKNVSLSSELLGDYVRINVRDEGPGLTEDDKQKVFGRFQKLSARPTAGEHSSGIGLSIVKSLVELHGGEVGVESTHGHGATFFVTLPSYSLDAMLP